DLVPGTNRGGKARVQLVRHSVYPTATSMMLAPTSRGPPIRDSGVANPELPHLFSDVNRVVDLLSEHHRAFSELCDLLEALPARLQLEDVVAHVLECEHAVLEPGTLAFTTLLEVSERDQLSPQYRQPPDSLFASTVQRVRR